MLAFSI